MGYLLEYLASWLKSATAGSVCGREYEKPESQPSTVETGLETRITPQTRLRLSNGLLLLGFTLVAEICDHEREMSEVSAPAVFHDVLFKRRCPLVSQIISRISRSPSRSLATIGGIVVAWSPVASLGQTADFTGGYLNHAGGDFG